MPFRCILLFLLCPFLLPSCVSTPCALISGVIPCGVEPVQDQRAGGLYLVSVCYAADSGQSPGNHPACDETAAEEIRRMMIREGFVSYEVIEVVCFQTIVAKCLYKVRFYR